MEAATPSCARSGLGLGVVAESPVLIGTGATEKWLRASPHRYDALHNRRRTARRDRRYKHDMTKEERKPLRLTASAYCLRSRTHPQRRSVRVAVDAKVKAAKTLTRMRSAGPGGGERGPRRRLAGRDLFPDSPCTTLGRPLVSP